MKLWQILIVMVLLSGCGSGSNSDDTATYNDPAVESDFVDVTLQWSPNSEPDLDGYRVFMHPAGEEYDYNNPEWETTDNDCKLYNLDKYTTYYFVVRAFDIEGFESGDSNEVILEGI